MANKNPQAFPYDETIRYHDRQDTHRYHEGMSLRDYFAGKALAGLMGGHHKAVIGMAEIAYQIADAMLEEREK